MKIKHWFSTTLIFIGVFSISLSSTPRLGFNSTYISLQQASNTSSIISNQNNISKMPLLFIANQGQMDNRVAYYIQGSDKTLYFTSQGVTFVLADQTSQSPLIPGKGKIRASERTGRWNIKLDFVAVNTVEPAGLEQTETIVSYFKGSQDQWHTVLPTYSKIGYPNLWQGIDLIYSGTTDRLKYEFVLHPGANPDDIRLAYHGANVKLNAAGQLEITTPRGGFTDDAPTAYQEVNGLHVPVAVSYALNDDGVYGFQLGAYDPDLPLVIDPAMLILSGFLGGDDDDGGSSIAVDSQGNIYIAGWTCSNEGTFPVKVGPDLSYNGAYTDAFVAKIKADGTGFIYVGFIGGNNWDEGYGIAVDSAGNAYVSGSTKSTEATFPVVVGPDLTYNGGNYDAFVAKVKADGSALEYCGYIGGSGDWETGWGIAVDSANHAYVTGRTYSSEATFPVIVGPDLTQNGEDDAFIVKVKSDGSGFEFAGFLGGSRGDYGLSIAVDPSFNVYVTGVTGSLESSFPVLVGPDLTFNGYFSDGFVAKVKPDGTGLLYCGYIGGIHDDEGHGITVDSEGHAFITGWTRSLWWLSFPSIGPDLTYNGGIYDAFVVKMKVDGSGYEYGGFIGGDTIDWGNSIAIDSEGNAYIAGETTSNEATFPVLDGPDLTHNGDYDAFVTKVAADGSTLIYSGFIGGDDTDYGKGIAVDASGNAYVTGKTFSTQITFPTAVGPDLTQNGWWDAFVAKVAVISLDYSVYLPVTIR